MSKAQRTKVLRAFSSHPPGATARRSWGALGLTLSLCDMHCHVPAQKSGPPLFICHLQSDLKSRVTPVAIGQRICQLRTPPAPATNNLQHQNLYQTVANTFLNINNRNSKKINKFLVGIFTRQGHNTLLSSRKSVS